MANVKLVNSESHNAVEVPEESAGPYLEAGWTKTKGAVQKNTPKAKTEDSAETKG